MRKGPEELKDFLPACDCGEYRGPSFVESSPFAATVASHGRRTANAKTQCCHSPVDFFRANQALTVIRRHNRRLRIVS